jgi:hypothetical protein
LLRTTYARDFPRIIVNNIDCERSEFNAIKIRDPPGKASYGVVQKWRALGPKGHMSGAGEACHSRARDRRQHGPRFLRNGLGLDGQGVADPALKEMKSADGCQMILREGSSPKAETGFPPSGSAGLGDTRENGWHRA